MTPQDREIYIENAEDYEKLANRLGKILICVVIIVSLLVLAIIIFGSR